MNSCVVGDASQPRLEETGRGKGGEIMGRPYRDPKEYELFIKCVKERDKALENVVLHDDLSGLRKFCARWRIPMPEKENVQRVAVYKAVQECANISEEVKQLAREKCEALGFNPTMK